MAPGPLAGSPLRRFCGLSRGPRAKAPTATPTTTPRHPPRAPLPLPPLPRCPSRLPPSPLPPRAPPALQAPSPAVNAPERAPLIDGEARLSLGRRALRVLLAGTLGGALVSAAGILGHELATGELWRVTDVTFAGQVNATEPALRHLANVRVGTHLFELDLQRVVLDVERHPWVRRAEARRVLPATIEVVVEEHAPVLILALDRMWYVNAMGEPFKLATTEDLDYPVLTGLSPRLAEEHPSLAAAVVQGALEVLEATDGHSTVGPEHSSEINFDPHHGYTLVLRNGSQLLLGFTDPERSLRRLDRLTANGLDLTTAQRVDLDAPRIALVSPLVDPSVPIPLPPPPDLPPSSAPELQ
jgi:cell division protein FtsQ